jgi:predicted RNA-binding Zn ribbon-like protein
VNTNLELIRDFVNTVDLEEPDGETLSTAAATRDWLAAHGLLAENARVSADDRERTIALREAIRGRLLLNNGVAVEPDSAPFEDASRRARLELRFSEDGRPCVAPQAGGVAGALGRILTAIAAAQDEGSWERLKACRAEDCYWAFIDTARNRSRAWCSMRSCGNRAKMRSYRERHAVV